MKKIYLDQNHLSALNHVEQGDARGEKYKNLLAEITYSNVENKVIYPISCLHVTETAKHQNLNTKKDIARFLFKITKGFAILPFYELVKIELKNAIIRRIRPQDEIDIQPIAQKGILYAFGNVDGIVNGFKIPDGVMLNENAYVETVQQISDEQISEWAEQDKIYQDFFENEKQKIKDLGSEQAFKIIVTDLFNFLIPIIHQILEFLNYDSRTYTNEHLSNEDDIKKFLREIDTMYVFSKILLKRDVSESKVHKNDVYDMSFLMTAIPYCDIIFTEGRWESLYRESGLSKEYKTTIVTKAEQLEQILTEINGKQTTSQ